MNLLVGLKHGQLKRGLKLHSKNKPAITGEERNHILLIKGLPCALCEQPPPSECHEIEQSLWFTSIPLCPDCHRGSFNGLHGQKRMWDVLKMSELKALNQTIKKLLIE